MADMPIAGFSEAAAAGNQTLAVILSTC